MPALVAKPRSVRGSQAYFPLWVAGLVLAAVCGCGPSPPTPPTPPAPATPPAPPPVILLVHGLVWGERASAPGAGPASAGTGKGSWESLIAALQEQGYRFGGIIRPASPVDLPACLDQGSVSGDPRTARVFCLDFSPAANTGGSNHRAGELKSCIDALKAYTGCRKVRIVAYSAGGLAARVYLQGIHPGLPYDHDVDRLITVGTPHLGVAAAKYIPRIPDIALRMLSPESEAIRNLNAAELPDDVQYASLVLNGRGFWLRTQGENYWPLADCVFLQSLPEDFRVGGDQIVHAISQNLRATQCGARYEANGRWPIQYFLVSANYSTMNPLAIDATLHAVCLDNAEVRAWVLQMALDDESPWTGLPPERRADWLDRQAAVCVPTLIQAQASSGSLARRSRRFRLGDLQLQADTTGQRRYHFTGLVQDWLHLTPDEPLDGTVEITYDAFGRIMGISGPAGS